MLEVGTSSTVDVLLANFVRVLLGRRLSTAFGYFTASPSVTQFVRVVAVVVLIVKSLVVVGSRSPSCGE